eukprot:2778728-Prymnesium_polylepis.2
MRVWPAVLRPGAEHLIVILLAEPAAADAVRAVDIWSAHPAWDGRLVEQVGLLVALMLDPRELVVRELVEVGAAHFGDVSAHGAVGARAVDADQDTCRRTRARVSRTRLRGVAVSSASRWYVP